MKTVYIETTVISYLAAWPSPELVMAARQQATAEWWEQELNAARGIRTPVICTPEELMEPDYET